MRKVKFPFPAGSGQTCPALHVEAVSNSGKGRGSLTDPCNACPGQMVLQGRLFGCVEMGQEAESLVPLLSLPL